MDEAHNCIDLILDHVGIEWTEKLRLRRGFPEFPVILKPSKFIGFGYNLQNNVDEVLDWFYEIKDNM